MSAVAPALAGELNLVVESGAVWFSRNDTRIPGDTGTKFDMPGLTGSGPAPYVRLYGIYAFNDRHALRVTIAPLEIEGTGTLKEKPLPDCISRWSRLDIVFNGI